MEQEKIITGYDPALMRRLLRYLKPYRRITGLAVVALVVATAAELLLPVVLQRTIDHNLVNTYSRVEASAIGRPELKGAKITPQDVRIGSFYYIPEYRLKAVTGVQKSRLVKQGIVDTRNYYVITLRNAEQQAVVSRNGSLFITGQKSAKPGIEFAAISAGDLKHLSPADISVVRQHDLSGLKRSAASFLGLLIGQLLFGFLQIYLMALTGQRVMQDIRIELFGHTMRQSLRFLGRHPVGKLVTRMTNDVETINELFTSVLVSLLQDVALMFGAIITLFSLDVHLGLITLATLPPVLIATLIYRLKAREAYRRLRLWISQVNAYLSEHLSGMLVVQLFAQENRSREEFQEKNQQLTRANLTQVYVFATFRPIIDLFSAISIATIIYFGAGFLLAGAISLGVLVAFINLIQKFYKPVMDISEKFTILQSALAGSERVFELLDEVDRIPDTGTSLLPPVRGELVFDHVSFSYKEGEPVIRDLSMRIEPGQTVAIVGYTGAGKTTIANLLTRLWDIQSGRILLDGVDIRDLPLSTLRTVIQPIQQDVFLFSDTIRENILLGKEMSDEELLNAARLVQADQFVQSLPDTYQSMLTEGATNISTGQRQLISFARVIAHDPRIIIMDEATANIDTETERLIQRALEALLSNRTALVIAHRLSTIKHSDLILVLSGGELVEQGNHAQLLEQRGVYYNLYRLQYSAGEEEQVG